MYAFVDKYQFIPVNIHTGIILSVISGLFVIIAAAVIYYYDGKSQRFLIDEEIEKVRLMKAAYFGGVLGWLAVILFMGWMEMFGNIKASVYGVIICMAGVVIFLFKGVWWPRMMGILDAMIRERED